jgi:hypothetical protein
VVELGPCGSVRGSLDDPVLEVEAVVPPVGIRADSIRRGNDPFLAEVIADPVAALVGDVVLPSDLKIDLLSILAA